MITLNREEKALPSMKSLIASSDKGHPFAGCLALRLLLATIVVSEVRHGHAKMRLTSRGRLRLCRAGEREEILIVSQPTHSDILGQVDPYNTRIKRQEESLPFDQCCADSGSSWTISSIHLSTVGSCQKKSKHVTLCGEISNVLWTECSNLVGSLEFSSVSVVHYCRIMFHYRPQFGLLNLESLHTKDNHLEPFRSKILALNYATAYNLRFIALFQVYA